jgi:hypothetical protein
MLLMLASCNSNDGGNNERSTTNSVETPTNQNNEANPDLSGCYLRVLKRDTLALSIQQSGKTVTGKLSFDNFEKDGSSGNVAGTIDNNILKLIYSFQSEGMHSVMEVYFKIADSALIHGIGEVAVKSDTAYYTKPNKISYPKTERLEKIDCALLSNKYK